MNIPGFIIEAGLRLGIPTMLHNSFHVEQGGLAAYSADLHQVGRQAARLVDKIIRGVKPADVPVEQATTFELVINLKTATAVGLTVPPSLLMRATRLFD